MTNQPMAKQQRGFTLIEAMIALVIFSVGLLGLAGMQMSGMQNNQSAILRTQAIQQSYDMAERIRANLGNATGAGVGGAYNNLNSGNVSCVGNAGSCSTIATFDFADWYGITQNVLPSGTGSVTGRAVNNGSGLANNSRLFTITVGWLEPTTGLNTNISLEIQP